MSEEEQNEHIGNLVVQHGQLKKELVCLRAKAKRYMNFWMRLNGDLQDIPYADSTEMSQYPSADEVQKLLDDLRDRKQQLESLTEELKTAGIELR